MNWYFLSSNFLILFLKLSMHWKFKSILKRLFLYQIKCIHLCTQSCCKFQKFLLVNYLGKWKKCWTNENQFIIIHHSSFFFVGKHVMQKSETFTTILSQMLKPEVIKQHEKLISSLYWNEMSNAANNINLYAAQIRIHNVNQK